MTSLRRLRTQRALAVAGLVAVATPLLSSCGFNQATDNPNTLANGGYHIYGPVHVLAARIVTPEQGTGTFVATITVDPDGKPVQVTGLSGEGLSVGQFPPISVSTNGKANLFADGGIPVTGDFAAGDNIPVTVELSDGESIEVDAIVVKQCYEYADVKTLSTKQSRQAQSEPSEPVAPYTCDYPSVPPLEATQGASE
jgi:hypothetical protein